MMLCRVLSFRWQSSNFINSSDYSLQRLMASPKSSNLVQDSGRRVTIIEPVKPTPDPDESIDRVLSLAK